MARLKVGLIGTGLIANLKHIPAWQRIRNDVDLAAICDLNEENAQKVAEKFGIGAVYSDIDKMLGEVKPDIVDVCTPPKTHCPIAVQVMDAGTNVFIEKPMAMDIEECDRIIEARDRNNVQVMCGHSDLFYDAFIRARRLLDEGAIGKFRGMRIFASTPRDYMTSKEDHWANKLPGGVIGETGPHIVYMTFPFIPKVEEVGVYARKILTEYPWSPFEDYRVTLVGAEAICSITLTYTNTQWLCQVELFGEDGILRLDLETQSVVRYTRPDLKNTTAAKSQMSEAAQLVSNTFTVGTRYACKRVASSHDLMLEAFAKCVREKGPSPVPAEEGRETVRVLGEITQQLEAKYGAAAAT